MRLFFMLLLVTSVSINCGKKPGMPNQDAVKEIPDSLVISLGSGGGFTGQWSGFTVYGSGNVESWSGRWLRDNPTMNNDTLSQDQLNSIWQLLDQSNYFDTTYSETGNFTAILKVNSALKNQSSQWIPSVVQVEQPKHETDSVYHAINEIIIKSIKQ